MKKESFDDLFIFEDSLIASSMNEMIGELDSTTMLNSNVGEGLPKALSKNNMVECFKQSYHNLLIHEKIQLSFLHESSKLDKMTSMCVACKKTISCSIHICTNLTFPENNGLIYALASFEKRFDLVLCMDSLMGVKNTILDEENEALFCLHTTTTK